ncbi:uncharacterized protein LOC124336713 [Daphnia pulicaria]|uniref:uncharacterized protein LOC124336713 n=1 Tax=Daphnia pulicaria TaxID=35523 RepID=UPI001EEA904A|nr:uncharacterized protein LOC124336713 [Daphnia pulicaria]
MEMEDDGRRTTLELLSISEIGNVFLGAPLDGQVDDIFLINSAVNEGKNNNSRMYIRHGANVVAFNVSSSGSSVNKPETWTRLWNRRFFNDAQRASYPLQTYPWLVTNTMLNDGSDGIVLRNEDGIGFYRFHPNERPIQVLGMSRDASFRDLYGWDETHRSVVLVARFYSDTRLIGVMGRQKIGKETEVKFYGASQERLKTRKPHPLFPLKKNKDNSVVAKISEAINLYTANVQRNGQDCIALRTDTQLEMHRFNDKFELQQVAKVSLVDGPWTSKLLTERFFFVDLTGQPYLDVVQFNRHGLFVYQLGVNQSSTAAIKDYTLVHYHAGFSYTNSWIAEYDESMRFVDADGDGHDDLLFTGSKGLTILTFDPVLLLWKTLLDPSSLLDTPFRFANVVGAINAVNQGVNKRESVLFILDEEKRLFVGNLLVKTVLNAPKTSHDSRPVPDITNQTLSKTSAVKIPSQVKRTTPISEKVVLRWTEQWAESLSISNLVDPVAGSVDFTLPIFEPSVSDPIPYRISLSYHSQQASLSNIVGSGWSLPLPDNYITVDYRGSIFSEDAVFYLTVDGTFLQLKPILTDVQVDDGVRLFQEYSQPKWTIKFHPKEQRWIITTETGTFTYGSARNMEAVRWNLSWPLWRGSGSDVKLLKRVPIAWYLIERQVKESGKSIIYHYEIDSVEYKNSRPASSWTAAIRLKQISVESSTAITFNYAIKEKEEYQTFGHPFDSENFVFPVRMRESHYLTGCQIVTEHYRQTLRFVYQVEKGRRLLTAIEQPIDLLVSESIFQFSYNEEEAQSAERLLTEIKLPSELKTQFRYNSIAAIDLPDPYSSVRHPVDEKPAISYSHDYAAMVFRQRQLPDKIQVKIMSAELLETLAELSPLPATTQTEGKIRSYNVLSSLPDFCIVLLETEKGNKKQMCLFYHKSKDGIRKWNKDLTCYWFHGDAIISHTESGVAVVDSNDILIFQLSADRSEWIKQKLKLPSSQSIIRLEMAGHLIVGYNDRQLFVCHPDGSKSKWQMRIIETIPNLFSGGSSIVKKFRLPSETEKMLIETLKQDILQLSSNSFVLTSLHLLDGQQLLLRMRLFLLDPDHNVVLRREFSIKTDNILQVRHEFHNNGTSYQLGYKVMNDNFFRLTVVDVSGDLWLDTQKNSPQPSKEEVLTEINALESFQKLFDTEFLVNWTAQRTVITAKGLYAGNNTLIRMTGGDWQLEEIKANKTENKNNDLPLMSIGNSFVLEETVLDANQEENHKMRNLTLYAQDPMDSNKKIGQALLRLEISPPDKIVSRYPVYLAYETRYNSTTVIFFSDNGKTLGTVFTFPDEQLVGESSSYDRLTTLAGISKEDAPEKFP